MLSRVAESMYWMSRYLERAENVARFIDVNQQISLGGSGSVSAQWQPLVATTGDQEPFAAKYGQATRENVLGFLTFDRDYPNSILSCLEKARENGRTIRDNIPILLWEELNKFFLMVRDASKEPDLFEEPHEFYQRVRLASHLLRGITDNTLSHGEPWHFGRIGRFIERADKTSRILDVKYFLLAHGALPADSQLDFVQWSALLHSVDGFGMYRRQHGRLEPEKVIAFLVLDRLFPRSIHHCVTQAEESLHAVTGTPVGTFSNKAEQRLGRLRSELDFTSNDEILAKGLHEFIDDLQLKLNAVGDGVFQCFFAVERKG
ncbi:MAG: alpha-E domain-containing protein [Polyangiales bacterium]